MTFITYMLRCSDQSFYVGHMDYLERRLSLHSQPGTRTYTSFRLPVRLEFPTRLEALQAERQIKGWSRAKKEALIRGDWGEISRLARPRPSTSSGRTPTNPARPEALEGRGVSTDAIYSPSALAGSTQAVVEGTLPTTTPLEHTGCP